VRMNTKALLDGLHAIFEALLRSSVANRALCLNWLWSCVEANNARSKIMSAYASLAENELELLNTISDGFALNLELLVLRLCEPFCNPPNIEDESAMNPKILSIDPSYTAVDSGPYCRAKWHEETCLMPQDENPDGTKVSETNALLLVINIIIIALQIKRVQSTSFTFITECFFLAQKTADIGSKPCRNRLGRGRKNRKTSFPGISNRLFYAWV
jgi:ubiquitin conjugation factor E4 A